MVFVDTIRNVLEPTLGDSKLYFNQLKFDCPHCDDGNKKNLEINLTTKAFHCWSCHYKGFITKLLKEYAANNSWIHLQELQNKTDVVYKKKDLALPGKLIPYYLNDDIKKYLLIERKLDKKIIANRDISYCYDKESNLYNHIIFPFYGIDNLLKGFCALDFSTRKYKNFGKLNYIPYEQFLDIDLPITITEGAIDALSVINAIPLLNTKLTEVVKRFCNQKNIILALDRNVPEETKLEYAQELNIGYNANAVYVLENFYSDLNEYRQKDLPGLRELYKDIFKLFNDKLFENVY